MKAARLFAVTIVLSGLMLASPIWAEGEDHSGDQSSTSESSRPAQEAAEAKELTDKINACLEDRRRITESASNRGI